MVPETAYILMTSVELDVVVVAVNHVVSVHVGVTVDASVGGKVSYTLDGIVEAVGVTADKVVVADDRGVVRLVEHDRLRTCGVAVKPAVRPVAGWVDEATLDHNFTAACVDGNGSVPVDAVLIAVHMRSEVTSELVVPRFADDAPVAHFAVAHPDGFGVLDGQDIF